MELDPQSDPGTRTEYPIAIAVTTINSKLVRVPWILNIVAGQYIVITFNTTLSRIDPNHIIGVRTVITVSGYDNNSLLIEADAEATASGNAILGAGTQTLRISPILITMRNKSIRCYVKTDDNGIQTGESNGIKIRLGHVQDMS